jgi:hypothetical protein
VMPCLEPVMTTAHREPRDVFLTEGSIAEMPWRTPKRFVSRTLRKLSISSQPEAGPMPAFRTSKLISPRTTEYEQRFSYLAIAFEGPYLRDHL